MLTKIYKLKGECSVFLKKNILWMKTYYNCFWFLAALVLCGAQLVNYAVKIIQMTLYNMTGA